jgi:hypothetical protein
MFENGADGRNKGEKEETKKMKRERRPMKGRAGRWLYSYIYLPFGLG